MADIFTKLEALCYSNVIAAGRARIDAWSFNKRIGDLLSLEQYGPDILHLFESEGLCANVVNTHTRTCRR